MASPAGFRRHVEDDVQEGTRSEATVRSFVSSANTSTRDVSRIPVSVQFGNGERIAVPLLPTARAQDLQFEALRRAARRGIHASPADTELRTTGANPSIVDEEDHIVDFLPLTMNNTFTLNILNRANATPAPTDVTEPTLYEFRSSPRPGSARPSSVGDALFIRWITIEDALGPHPLKRLSVDKLPEGTGMTVAQLYRTAATHLVHSGEMRGIHRIIDPARIRLWSKYGPLSRESNQYSMRDLDFGLDPREPLDIFVQIQGPRMNTNLGQVGENFNAGQDWGLDVSLRGVSTFITSLQILIKEIERNNISINSVLDTLLRVTRFPPTLLAFTHLHASGVVPHTPMEHLHLLVDVFDALCKVMVPEWLCVSDTSRLEGSRQVISWIHNLCITGSSQNNPMIPRHVHRAQISVRGTPPARNHIFDESAVINFPNGPSYTVSLETRVTSSVQGLVLAAALQRRTEQRWHYYTLPSPSWNAFMQSLPLKRPSASEFDNLLVDANASRAFRIIDPMKLGACLSADLPVATLGGKGFVSRYDQEDVECSERQFYLWNCVTKKTIFKSQDPGQQISASLEPIIAARKKERTWELDAWTEWTDSESHGPPDESIVICVDRSWSMDDKMPLGWNPSESDATTQPSRLHEVKDFFNHFSTRLCAYNLSTHTGLVTFSKTAEVVQPLTALQTQFTSRLDKIVARGMTAIYDALHHACGMLIEQKAKFPGTKCRVILLTDGEDNASSNTTAKTVCSRLFDNDVVLDAIVLGTSLTTDLFKIARSTGGYAFSPTTQRVFFQLFLLETLIDIRTRPDIQNQRVLDWDSFKPKEADMRDEYSFPPCRPHPNQTDNFIVLRDAKRYWGRRQSHLNVPSGTGSISSSGSAGVGERVLLAEVKAMVDHEHKDLDVYVSERNMGFWKVVMEGPEGSPYEGGVFLLYVDVGLDFPRVPPGIRFITPILHPNISKHGRICHPIFDREWTGTIRIHEILMHIYGLLMTLESRDTIDPIAALKFYTDPDEGRRQVRNYIDRFAKTTRAEHREAIADNDDMSSLASSVASASSSATARTPSSQASTLGVPDAPYVGRRQLAVAVPVRPPPLISSLSRQPGGASDAARSGTSTERRSRTAFFDRLRRTRG